MSITTATTHYTFEQMSTPSIDPRALELARLTLACAAPIEIEHLRFFDGPNDWQIEQAQGYIQQQKLGEALMFTHKGETAAQMRLLCEVVAILAFCPGGVSVLGLHFEAEVVR